MRYLVVFSVVFSLSSSFAEAHTPVYVLNDSDVSSFYRGFQQALEGSPNYQASLWSNPRTGLSGATVPLKTLQAATGQVCREYLATLQLQGAARQSVGTACRQANGSWQIVGEDLVQSDAVQLRFVVVRQQRLQRPDCAHGNHARSTRQLRTQVPAAQGNKRFHSEQFHESLPRLQRQPAEQTPRKQQQRPVPKLIQLVGY